MQSLLLHIYDSVSSPTVEMRNGTSKKKTKQSSISVSDPTQTWVIPKNILQLFFIYARKSVISLARISRGESIRIFTLRKLTKEIHLSFISIQFQIGTSRVLQCCSRRKRCMQKKITKCFLRTKSSFLILFELPNFPDNISISAMKLL